MDPLLAARAQMGLSLAFHMIFAALGIGMPLFMVLAEGLGLRTGKPEYFALAKKWAKATGLLFAVGAVSGTALSFELGLLWPRFMEFAGPMIGPAFALEGYAFFLEAIFLGLYLYGWDRLKPTAHWLCGIPVAVCGAVSGILVVAADAWMQHPNGFRLAPREALALDPASIDPTAVFSNPAWGVMALHSTLSCYVATAFAMAGVYAWGLWRGRKGEESRTQLLALRLAMAVGAVTALAIPLSGDLNGSYVAKHQPEKLAAMEAHFETQRGADFLVGGVPDMERAEVRGGLRIPKLLSVMAYRNPDAEVKGLRDFPRENWPNVPVVRVFFQVMVGCGLVLAGVSLLFWYRQWRKTDAQGHPRWLAGLLVACGPLGFVALEAGWMVTEVGRQPWIVRGVMRTAQAVTPAAEIQPVFWSFSLLYILLGVTVAALLWKLGNPSAPQAANPNPPAHPVTAGAE